MTWLWTALIVVGVAMIGFAVWPSIRGNGRGGAAANDPAGVAETDRRTDPEGL